MALGDAEIRAPAERGIDMSHEAGWTQLLPIVLVNLLLTIVTVGIYHFWAKTRVRRYLWSRATINGEPLEWTGTGWELFASFVMVLIVFFLPLYGLSYVLQTLLPAGSPLQLAGAFALSAVVFFAIGWAFYRAHAYRASRTAWQGVRFSLSGSGVPYALKMMGYSLLIPFTLGWIIPQMNMALMRQIVSHLWFGNARFAFTGRASRLYGPFAAAYFLTIGLFVGLFIVVSPSIQYSVLEADRVMTQSNPTERSAPPRTENPTGERPAKGPLAGGDEAMEGNADPDMPELPFDLDAETLGYLAGIALGLFLLLGLVALIATLPFIWYAAREMKTFAQSTSFGNLAFDMRATGLSLMWLYLGNVLIIIFTLGLGLAFTQMRTMKYFFHRLEPLGDIDPDTIAQSEIRRPRIGEGLADALDLGLI